MKYNVLILHNMADFSNTLRSMAEYVLCFERYVPQHNYLYHKITAPVTDALRDIRFHLIIIDASALGICRYRPRDLWYAEKARWSFLGDTDAIKFAFPQDDYHQSAVLDELFSDWGFDTVYTVLPEHHEIVYPRTTRKAEVTTVLTGYVDDNSITEVGSFARPFEERRIDIGQRVLMYSPLGGRHARLKGEFAEAMGAAARQAGYRVDVSTRQNDRIMGDNWLRFLGDCRFVPGCESGVSIWDPDGRIFDRVEAYVADHPQANFEEVEAACFPGLDGRHVFSAISPRLFEAAMMGCCQVLIEAPYLGVLHPEEHYIPVRPDLSDLSVAVDQMSDTSAAKRRVEATYAALIDTPEFRYSTLSERVMARADELVQIRHVAGSSDLEFQRLKAAHETELRAGSPIPESPMPDARITRLCDALPPSVRAVVPRWARRAAKRVISKRGALS